MEKYYNHNKRKVIITVAPVCHVEKNIPEESRNPVSPEEIADEVFNCEKAGAAMVHLHVRDEQGRQTFDLGVFKKTLDLITAKSDLIIQGSTGGLADFTLEERCVCLNEPRVEIASLNMGSVNFGETVYINTLPDIRFWASEMKKNNVIPELEHFDLSMVDTTKKLAAEGVLEGLLHFNFCLGDGHASSLPATVQNLACLVAAIGTGGHWGLTHDSMNDFSMLVSALSMGASGVRVGFEDSFFYAPGKLAATNAELVQRFVSIIKDLGFEPATPQEARKMLGLEY